MRYWPAAVGDGSANLFDERGAGGLDGDTRQHGARGIPDHACNLLSVREGGEQDDGRQDCDLRKMTHGSSTSAGLRGSACPTPRASQSGDGDARDQTLVRQIRSKKLARAYLETG